MARRSAIELIALAADADVEVFLPFAPDFSLEAFDALEEECMRELLS
jgi:hypothetical protein